MLEPQETVRVSERRVVQRRDVPQGVRPDPEGQSHHGLRQDSDDTRPRQSLAELRRDPEDQEQRRPLGEHDVLDEVRPDEVLARDRVERRDERRHQERTAGEERDCPRAVPGTARGDEVGGCESDGEERLGAP